MVLMLNAGHSRCNQFQGNKRSTLLLGCLLLGRRRITHPMHSCTSLSMHRRASVMVVVVVVVVMVVRAATALLPAAGVARCSLQGLAAEQAVK